MSPDASDDPSLQSGGSLEHSCCPRRQTGWASTPDGPCTWNQPSRTGLITSMHIRLHGRSTLNWLPSVNKVRFAALACGMHRWHHRQMYEDAQVNFGNPGRSGIDCLECFRSPRRLSVRSVLVVILYRMHMHSRWFIRFHARPGEVIRTPRRMSVYDKSVIGQSGTCRHRLTKLVHVVRKSHHIWLVFWQALRTNWTSAKHAAKLERRLISNGHYAA